MARVWNVTDGGQPGVTPHSRMVLGRLLKPGRSIEVGESQLLRARKTHRDVEAKLLHVGPTPPSWYSKKRAPARAILDARKVDPGGNAHGPRVAVASGHKVVGIVEAVPEPKTPVPEPKVEPEHIPEPEVAAEPMEMEEVLPEEPTDTSKEDSGESGSSSRRKSRRRKS
jgi:hypothetical protein